MGVEIFAMFDFGLSDDLGAHAQVVVWMLSLHQEVFFKKPFLNPKRPWTMSSRGPESDQRVMLSQCSYIYIPSGFISFQCEL